jgi:GNAT superfamily N-acetyltransferase
LYHAYLSVLYQTIIPLGSKVINHLRLALSAISGVAVLRFIIYKVSETEAFCYHKTMSNTEASIERLTKYSAEDAAGIGRLMPFLSSSMNAEPMPENLLRDIINSPYHEQLVARLDSIIVGAATLNILMGPATNRVGYLEDFVTDPLVRGSGVGGKLWDEMIAWCNEQGVGLEFTSNASRAAAHRFYLSRGATIRDTTVFQLKKP